MAYTRTTVGGIGGTKFPSRTPGDPTGLSINSFLIGKIKEVLSGEQVAPILLWAMEPAYEQAKADWPVVTGASSDTIRLETDEIEANFARVSLRVGGEQLMQDPRNKKGIDYAPFVEFNGTSKTPPGTITHAVIITQDEVKERIKLGLQALLGGAIGG